VVIHCTLSVVAPKSFSIAGYAMPTIAESNTEMNMPMDTVIETATSLCGRCGRRLTAVPT
jgi:hypothetical protein